MSRDVTLSLFNFETGNLPKKNWKLSLDTSKALKTFKNKNSKEESKTLPKSTIDS